MLIGIKEGEKKEGSAGKNRGSVSLTVENSIVTINDRKVAINEDVLVIFHKSDSGTWHDFRNMEELKIKKIMEVSIVNPQGIIKTSCSGGADVVGAVVKVPPEGLCWLTSGYCGRRNWMVHIVKNNVYESMSYMDYKAKYAEIETL
jgi:hypothetical protein